MSAALAACGDDGGGAHPDASIPEDAGRRDAGPRTDAASGADAGLQDLGPTDDGGTTTGTIALADLCTQIHGAVCNGLRSCGCSLEGRDYDLTSCDEQRALRCAQSIAPYVDAIEQGIVGFDPAAAFRCRRGIEAIVARCARVDDSSLPIDCRSFFVDVAAIDAPCTTEYGTICAGGAGVCAPVNAELRCVTRPGEGAPCEADTCATGLFCNLAESRCWRPLGTGDPCAIGGCPEGEICRPEGVCGARLGNGEGPCRASGECADGLTCDRSGNCAPGAELDAACDGPFTCASGLACVRRHANRSCQTKTSSGGACGASAECEDQQICTLGVCGPRPIAGGSCAETNEGLTCTSTTVCDVDGGMLCVPGPGLDEACLIGSAECATGLGCDPNTNTCIAPPGEGEPCTIPHNLCAEGLGCDFTAKGSICALRRGQGAQCQSHQICQDGLFCDFTTATCAPLKAQGELCPIGELCQAGLECNDLAGPDACNAIPTSTGAACLHACGGGLACKGPGGACEAAICSSP